MNLVDQIAEVLHGSLVELDGHPVLARPAFRVAAEIAKVVRPRITSQAELDALPVGALVGYHDSTRTFRRLWTADDGDSEHFWQEPGGYAYRSADIPLPATLIYTPGDTE